MKIESTPFFDVMFEEKCIGCYFGNTKLKNQSEYNERSSIPMDMSSKPKKSKTYHFNEEWELDYFSTMVNDKYCCLICLTSVAIAKKGNLERHFLALHNKYQTDNPPNSELRKHKNKSEIVAAIQDLQLSRNTVMRRIEVMKGNCDESTDISDTAQSLVFVRMVFKDFTSKEELLECSYRYITLLDFGVEAPFILLADLGVNALADFGVKAFADFGVNALIESEAILVI
ncbi:hypothetical protein J437_LFUL014902 [Ladona fulva]|uniref:Uncharacterized protein n=1 Tax=Ladona fulva TaxID=123851 RepID=A0A8K0P5B9_LADFU|nr:hypothetical protein J437_LFUL014902 [Ladona fulva]